MTEPGPEVTAAEELYQRIEEPFDVVAGMVSRAAGKAADRAVETVAKTIKKRVGALSADTQKPAPKRVSVVPRRKRVVVYRTTATPKVYSH